MCVCVCVCVCVCLCVCVCVCARACVIYFVQLFYDLILLCRLVLFILIILFYFILFTAWEEWRQIFSYFHIIIIIPSQFVSGAQYDLMISLQNGRVVVHFIH